MTKEHLASEVLEETIEWLLNKLNAIKELTYVDTGQKKAPTKSDYQNACLLIRREVEKAADKKAGKAVSGRRPQTGAKGPKQSPKLCDWGPIRLGKG